MVRRRILLAASAGAAAGVLSAVIIAITDIYLSGHGNPGLLREYITWSAAGVHLSIGDMIMFGAALAAAAIAWWLPGGDV